MTQAEDAFSLLAEELREDPDADVVLGDDGGVYVKGARFAFLDGNALAVRLPPARARDLDARGLARYRPGNADWVLVTDRELWSELAAEAHTYVGEPPVGGDS